MEIIRVSRLSFAYPSTDKILKGVNLRVKEGELVGLIGEVGSGKTTLLSCINGVIPKLVKGKIEGEVEVLGKDPIKEGARKMSSLISTVLQSPDDQLFLTSVYDEVAFSLRNRGIDEEETRRRVDEALSRVGIIELKEKNPIELSLGQKQKVILACALAMKNKIMVLDEPCSCLGRKGKERTFKILREECEEGRTAIVAEHDIKILEKNADRIFLLHNGRIKVLRG
ncbi:MAG: ABC transporter ATP-binding protein [Candidatus Anstonellales archaeon]